jgi:alpha-tubulin suppressor-like RCC1 family protein
VAAGSNFSLAIDLEGWLYAWGGGHHGQIGLGELENVNTPHQVQLPAGAKITKIAAGEFFSMALTDTGELYTFGSQGTGHNTSNPVPRPRALNFSNAVLNGRIVTVDHMDGGNCHGCILVDVEATNVETDRPWEPMVNTTN